MYCGSVELKLTRQVTESLHGLLGAARPALSKKDPKGMEGVTVVPKPAILTLDR